MTIQTKTYFRREFPVEAVEVTEENIEDVAKWCNGMIYTNISEEGERRYIKVKVHRPITPRQTRAFVGDMILVGQNKGFKVYTPVAFVNSFRPAEEKDVVNTPPEDVEELMTVEDSSGRV